MTDRISESVDILLSEIRHELCVNEDAVFQAKRAFDDEFVKLLAGELPETDMPVEPHKDVLGPRTVHIGVTAEDMGKPGIGSHVDRMMRNIQKRQDLYNQYRNAAIEEMRRNQDNDDDQWGTWA